MHMKKNKDIEVTLEELRRDRKKRKKIQEEIKKMIAIPRKEEVEKDEKEDN